MRLLGLKFKTGLCTRAAVLLALLCLPLLLRAQPESGRNGKPGQATGSSAKGLKVLTWNIYLLPGMVSRSKQKKRAGLIAQTLLQSDYDVVCFQEAFHRKGVKRLRGLLAEKYPHQTETVNKKGAFKFNSGLLLVSRHPMEQKASVAFGHCASSDCMAKKGAVLVEIDKGGDTYQILNTHLQADYAKKYYPEIRKNQFQAILGSLLQPYAKSGVPQILCGDWNTDKSDTLLYNYMRFLLQANDGKLLGDKTYKADDFSKNPSPSGAVYDYVLYRPNGKPSTGIVRQVKHFKSEWKPGKSDLSDHYGVEAVIGF